MWDICYVYTCKHFVCEWTRKYDIRWVREVIANSSLWTISSQFFWQTQNMFAVKWVWCSSAVFQIPKMSRHHGCGQSTMGKARSTWYVAHVCDASCVMICASCVWRNLCNLSGLSYVYLLHLVRQVVGKLTHIKANRSRKSVIRYLIQTIIYRNTSNIGICQVWEWIWVVILPKFLSTILKNFEDYCREFVE